MCGIAGIVSWGQAPDLDTVKRMATTIRHRGPDANGLWSGGSAVLAHRRLSVIDLSVDANQPMVDPESGLVIVFNGEIYNFRSIRKELEQRGVKVVTNSDTEILLKAYREWGADCLAKLDGMFAFAIWDPRRERLFAARDPFGEKPFFYWISPTGGIVFASEMKAILEVPEVPRRIDPKGLSQYLALNYVLSPTTILAGIKKLEPAHYLELDRDRGYRQQRYWDLSKSFCTKATYRDINEAADEFIELFDRSVQSRMVSDVPLGAFLSGGVDSSSVVASMVAQGGAHNVKTFSAGFKEKTYSELPHAMRAANHLEVDHNETIVLGNIRDDYSNIIDAADEPFADSSFIPMYYLAEFARRQVTVALSGDGADELFLGYQTYNADKLAHWMRFTPTPLIDALEWGTSALVPATRNKVSFDYKLKHFLRGMGATAGRAHFNWRLIQDTRAVQEILEPELYREVKEYDPYDEFKAFEAEVADCHYLDKASYVDIKTWLVDDILVKVDRSTMAHSLEARVPFLTREIAEFAAALPVEYKLKRLANKRIVKASQVHRLPQHVLDRKKEGFNAPVSHWLVNELREEIEGTIRNGTGVFHGSNVRRLLDQHVSKNEDNGLKLFGILNFELWHRNLQ